MSENFTRLSVAIENKQIFKYTKSDLAKVQINPDKKHFFFRFIQIDDELLNIETDLYSNDGFLIDQIISFQCSFFNLLGEESARSIINLPMAMLEQISKIFYCSNLYPHPLFSNISVGHGKFFF